MLLCKLGTCPLPLNAAHFVFELQQTCKSLFESQGFFMWHKTLGVSPTWERGDAHLSFHLARSWVASRLHSASETLVAQLSCLLVICWWMFSIIQVEENCGLKKWNGTSFSLSKRFPLLFKKLHIQSRGRWVHLWSLVHKWGKDRPWDWQVDRYSCTLYPTACNKDEKVIVD